MNTFLTEPSSQVSTCKPTIESPIKVWWPYQKAQNLQLLSPSTCTSKGEAASLTAQSYQDHLTFQSDEVLSLKIVVSWTKNLLSRLRTWSDGHRGLHQRIRLQPSLRLPRSGTGSSGRTKFKLRSRVSRFSGGSGRCSTRRIERRFGATASHRRGQRRSALAATDEAQPRRDASFERSHSKRRQRRDFDDGNNATVSLRLR